MALGSLLNIMRKVQFRSIAQFLVCIACFCWGGFLFFRTPLPAALIVETETGICLSLPTYPGDTLRLRFIHSVHKTPVWEIFTVEAPGQLKLIATEYQSYGVGMPSLPSEGTFIQEADRFILKDLDRRFSVIPVRAGPETQLTLIHRGKEYPLYEMVKPGETLFIRSGK